MLNLVTADTKENQVLTSQLDQIAREGARRMLAEALSLEVAEYVDSHKDQRDDQGKAMVVRNGKAKARKVTVGSGTFEIQSPRVNDRRQGQSFTSAILPPLFA